jgi:hypothetical protein
LLIVAEIRSAGMSAITVRPLVMGDLTADVFALFELVDDDRKDQLLDYWQQLFDRQRAAKLATA